MTEDKKWGPSVLDRGAHYVERVAHALGLDVEARKRVVDTFRIVGSSLGHITHDQLPVSTELFWSATPFDISCAYFGDEQHLRFELEPQTVPASLKAFNEAMDAVVVTLEASGAHPARYRDLRRQVGERFAVHPGVRFDAAGNPAFKGYISRHYRLGEAFDGWHDFLERAGHHESRAAVAKLEGELGFVLNGFGCPLDDEGEVEIYGALTPREAWTSESVERIGALARDYHAGDFSTFLEAILGPEPWAPRPYGLIVLSFISTPDGLREPTCFVPMPFAHGDELASPALMHERVRQSFKAFNVSASAYERTLEALDASSDDGFLHYFASFRRVGGRPRPTIYFTPNLSDAPRDGRRKRVDRDGV